MAGFIPWAIAGAAAGLLTASWPLAGFYASALVLLVALLRPDRLRSLSACLLGGSLPLLWVAWRHRHGPGTVSGATPTGGWSTEYLDPVPWLMAGLLVLALGLALGVLATAGRAGGAGERTTSASNLVRSNGNHS